MTLAIEMTCISQRLNDTKQGPSSCYATAVVPRHRRPLDRVRATA